MNNNEGILHAGDSETERALENRTPTIHKITAENPPQFPCWFTGGSSTHWTYWPIECLGNVPSNHWKRFGFTHWMPYTEPTRPTEAPDAANSAANHRTDTPETDRIAKALGKLSASYKFRDLNAAEFCEQAERIMDEVRQIERERDQLKAQLGNILARIHRDGGHYQEEHGTEKAVKDADAIIANLYPESEQLNLASCERRRAIAAAMAEKHHQGDIAACARAETAEAQVRTLREALDEAQSGLHPVHQAGMIKRAEQALAATAPKPGHAGNEVEGKQ